MVECLDRMVHGRGFAFRRKWRATTDSGPFGPPVARSNSWQPEMASTRMFMCGHRRPAAPVPVARRPHSQPHAQEPPAAGTKIDLPRPHRISYRRFLLAKT